MHRKGRGTALGPLRSENLTHKVNYKQAALGTSSELQLLFAHSKSLQDLLSEVISPKDKTPNSATIQQLQSLDYLTQSLSELAGFWDALAKHTPDEWEIESAVKVDVKLQGLSDRLSGKEVRPVCSKFDEDGTLHLF